MNKNSDEQAFLLWKTVCNFHGQLQNWLWQFCKFCYVIFVNGLIWDCTLNVFTEVWYKLKVNCNWFWIIYTYNEKKNWNTELLKTNGGSTTNFKWMNIALEHFLHCLETKTSLHTQFLTRAFKWKLINSWSQHLKCGYKCIWS